MTSTEPVLPSASTDPVIQVGAFQAREHAKFVHQSHHKCIALRTLRVHALII